jgi:hypothetical protein
MATQMSGTSRSALQSFAEFVSEGTRSLLTLSGPILVIPKAESEAQTENPLLSDAETETLTPKEVKVMMSPQKRASESNASAETPTGKEGKSVPSSPQKRSHDSHG